MKITRHKDLPIWQIAVGLVKECYNVTDSFPLNEKFELKAQIRRAAVSITPIIAGGSVRHSSDDYSDHLCLTDTASL